MSTKSRFEKKKKNAVKQDSIKGTKKRSKAYNVSVIRSNKDIRSAFLRTIIAKNLTAKKIIEDALEIGVKIEESALSRYINHGDVPGSLTERNILFLCTYYLINVKIVVTSNEGMNFQKMPEDQMKNLCNKLYYFFPETRMNITKIQDKWYDSQRKI